MPNLLYRHPFQDAIFGIWQISEPEAFYRQDFPISEQEFLELAHLKGIRRMEWLAARWLLHQYTGAAIRLPLAKDAFSKPFFPEHRHLSCSLSHSHGIVGALLAREAPVGCDIQVIVPKMDKLAHKFMHPDEQAFVLEHPAGMHSELYHIFWTAKESLYKAYGIKALDFREHMRLLPFQWENGQGAGRGWIEKGDYRQEFQLWFEKCPVQDGGQLIWTVCRGI